MTRKITKSDYQTIGAIAHRAQAMFFNAGVERDYLDCMMDIECVHERIGLRLDELAMADNSNFAHDIGGIARHLNRETKELEDFFVPRYAVQA